VQEKGQDSELDVKLASFRKVHIDPKVEGQRDGTEVEIERLLHDLNDVNMQLQNSVLSAGSGVLSHTIVRTKILCMN
jgi:hypothetical protein